MKGGPEPGPSVGTRPLVASRTGRMGTGPLANSRTSRASVERPGVRPQVASHGSAGEHALRQTGQRAVVNNPGQRNSGHGSWYGILPYDKEKEDNVLQRHEGN